MTIQGKPMRRSTTLESRLNEWAKEYREGKREHLGGSSGSWLASLIRWEGRAPSGLGHQPERTAADEVHEAVAALECQPTGYGPAMVLRAEYLNPDQPRMEKIRRLRRLGVAVDTTRFSQLLRLAKIHVAGWLHIPFNEPLTDHERVQMLEAIVELD
jgi:hypothetical protein